MQQSLGFKNNSRENKVYIIHENLEWIKPLMKYLEELSVPYEQWFVKEDSLDLESIPPRGVFYNRMSASSHTRGNRFAPELTGSILSWLILHNRRVINSRRALQLEIRKSEQYLSLKAQKLNVPKTYVTVGHDQLLFASTKFNGKPFIVKPNRGGKGTNVVLFESRNQLEEYIKTTKLISLDGILLVQEYIKPKDGRVVRMEFVGGKFIYAVSIDSSKGFKLCPADICEIPVKPNSISKRQAANLSHRFNIISDFQHPIISLCEAFLLENGIDIAGIEFAENDKNELYLYDVNTNTNYNHDAEKRSGLNIFGMKQIAIYLKNELSLLKNKNEFNATNNA